MTDFAEIFKEAVQLTKRGDLSSSFRAYQEILTSKPLHYSSLVNSGLILIQLGDINRATQFLDSAIKADPFCHIAYFNRFLCYYSRGDLPKAYLDIEKSLSCLYTVKGFASSNITFLNQAIQLCDRNIKAYLCRAELQYERGKHKFAENDYDAAVEYGQQLLEPYAKKALHYRKVGKTAQFQEALVDYINAAAKNQSKTTEFSLGDDLKVKDQYLETAIRRLLSDFESLNKQEEILPLDSQIEDAQVIPESVQKLPLGNMKSGGASEDEMLLSSNRNRSEEEEVNKLIKKAHVPMSPERQAMEEHFEKRFETIFQDQPKKQFKEDLGGLADNSMEIRKEVEKMAREMEISEISPTKPLDHEKLFMDKETDKVFGEIDTLKNTQISDLLSPRSSKSLKSILSTGKTEMSISEITMNEFSNHKSFSLELVQMDLFGETQKKNAQIQVVYGEKKSKTKFTKTEWRETFVIDIVPSLTDVQVKVTIKNNWSIWGSQGELGTGTINLLETGNTKCLIGDKEKKRGIVYYKLHLS